MRNISAAMSDPFISICIPAYKRPENVENLLRSIEIQTFTDFEVIITDDSPDDSLKSLIQNFPNLPISYFRNQPALGTPANWNAGITRARGTWIKLMHDDDWFASEKALEEFAQATTSEKKFIFSNYINVFEETGRKETKLFPVGRGAKIIQNPLLLLAQNIIGPPSVTMIHKTIVEQYDTFMKWRVDIDFYIRLLLQEKDFYAINMPLVNVGISPSQVTNSCIDKPEVELPEGLLLLTKYGVHWLKNIWVYDAWWRILRNVLVRNRADLKKYTPYNEWPKALLKMADHQAMVSQGLLKIGAFSKMFMLFSFLANRKNLNNFN